MSTNSSPFTIALDGGFKFEDEYFSDYDEEGELTLENNGTFYASEPGHPPVVRLDYFRVDEEVHEQARGYARKALETFKDDNGKQYELVDILIFDWCCYFEFYVTFSAKQKDAPEDDADALKTIRAIIEDDLIKVTVTECIFKLPYRILPDLDLSSIALV